MIDHLRDFRTREALPRMLADMAIVQLAAILSLLFTFGYYIFFLQGEILSRTFFVETLRGRYLTSSRFSLLCFRWYSSFLESIPGPAAMRCVTNGRPSFAAVDSLRFSIWRQVCS